MQANSTEFNFKFSIFHLLSSAENTVRTVRRVTLTGFWVNAALMVLKILFGIYGQSDALVADGVHSLSDFATDVVVLVFVGMAYKAADSDHPYGHGKYETLASLLIAVALIGVGVGIGWSGVKTIVAVAGGEVPARPDVWTLVVVILSIAAKEWLFRYTRGAGRKVGSTALQANAWHHRSDAISSVATLVGISAAYFMGTSWRVLDPVASVVIAGFIVWSGIGIARPSLGELLESGLPADVMAKIGDTVAATPGVRAYHRLRARRNGHSVIVDLHIKVDPDITVTRGHDIATDVEMRLHAVVGDDAIIGIHVEPYNIRS